MAIINGYTTLAELKARLNSPPAANDAVLESVIEAVSRWIDKYCGRRFYALSETRYFTAEDDELVFVGDLLSVTSLATDRTGDRSYGDIWQSTDYDLEPANADLDGKPFTQIRTAPTGRYSFPTFRRGVKVVGEFGYSLAAPDEVSEACLLQASRLFRRKDAPFGVAGAPEIGQMSVIPRLDPDVRTLLDPFRKMSVGAV